MATIARYTSADTAFTGAGLTADQLQGVKTAQKTLQDANTYGSAAGTGTAPSTGGFVTDPSTGLEAPAASGAPVTRYTTPGSEAFGSGGAYASRAAVTPAEEAAIRESSRTRVQSQIDAVNEMAAQELAAARERAAQRAGQSRARLANTGGAGSGSETTEQGRLDAQKKAEEDAIAKEKQAKIDSILNGVEDRSTSLINSKNQSAALGADKYAAFVKDTKAQAETDLKTLAASGVELSSAQRQKLMEQTGYDAPTFDALYKSMRIANSAAGEYINKDKPEIIGNKAIFFKQTKDPKTGAVSLSKEEVALPESTQEIDKVTSDTNGIYVFYKNGTWKKVAEPTPKDSGAENADEQLYSGLTKPTQTAVRARVTSYKTEPLVQNFGTIQDGYNFSKSISDTTTNPADDQALIYSLAKALDPGSVVREGEYATAQKYAQSWIKAYGKAVEQAILGTGFLSEDARKNIKKTIAQKYESSKTSYDTVHNAYKSGIDSLTGRTDGDKFLTNYVTATPVTPPASAAGSTPAQVVEYPKGSGKKYNVDAAGNMTPIQ